MASSYYLVEDPHDEVSAVLSWFRELASPPEELVTDWGLWLQFGPLVRDPDGQIDVEQSPLVSLFPSKIRHGVLWTAAEVHFQARSKSAGGKTLTKVQREFRDWLALQDVVFEQIPAPESPHAYYLEGGLQNVARVVYAPPSGVAALRRGQYVIPHGANDHVLDRLCRTLKLRGVDCTFPRSQTRI